MKTDPRKLKKVVRFDQQPLPTLTIGPHPRITKSTQSTSPLTINEKLYLRSLTIPKIVITRSGSGNLSETDDSHLQARLRKTVSLTDLKQAIAIHDLVDQLASLSTGNPWKNQNFDDNVLDTFKSIKLIKKKYLQI